MKELIEQQCLHLTKNWVWNNYSWDSDILFFWEKECAHCQSSIFFIYYKIPLSAPDKHDIPQYFLCIEFGLVIKFWSMGHMRNVSTTLGKSHIIFDPFECDHLGSHLRLSWGKFFEEKSEIMR